MTAIPPPNPNASHKRACGRKRRWTQRGKANKARKHREQVTGLKLYVYKCPNCWGFHLTKMPQDLKMPC